MTSQEFVDFCKKEYNFDVHCFLVDGKIFNIWKTFKDYKKLKLAIKIIFKN